MDKLFYVYEHWRPDKNICFYVGKGVGRRAFLMARRNKHHAAIRNILIKSGLSVEVIIISVDLSEDNAFKLERRRIAYWRRLGVRLANRTNGGEGASGPSAEVRARMRAAKLGRKMSPEAVEKMAASRRGKPRSNETRNKIRLAQIGLPKRRDRIEKMVATRMANGNYGRSLETRAKQAASLRATLAAKRHAVKNYTFGVGVKSKDEPHGA